MEILVGVIVFVVVGFALAIAFGKFCKAGRGGDDPVEKIEVERL